MPRLRNLFIVAIPMLGMAEGKDENIFERRAEEGALSVLGRNRLELIRFFQSLAQSDTGPIPDELRNSDAASTSLAIARKAYEEARESLAGRISSMEPEQAGLAVARLCIGLFAVERADKLREMALKYGSLGAFSLYSTLRDRVGSAFSSGFYSSSQEEMIGHWLDIEPLFSACSGLFGLSVPELHEIVREFQPRIAESMAEYDK